MDVIWTGDRPWGDEHFRDPSTGHLYRKATKREEPDLLVPTPNGEVRLRRMSRKEIQQINPERGN